MSTTTTNALQVLKSEQPTYEAITLFNYGPDKDVSSIVLNEISCLENIAIAKPEILSCEPISIQQAMKFVLKNNLTLDPNAGLVYTKTRNLALQKDQQGNVTKWGKILEVQPTCEGLLSIAYQCGKIIDHERPSVKKNNDGKVIEVTFRFMKPSPTGPRWVEVSFDESDFKRWKDKSHQENARGKADASTKDYSNINYRNFNGGIDPEFARAKSIRHALKKLGTNPNERLMVHIKPAIANTIEVKVDTEVTAEETTTEATATEYTPYTEATPLPTEQPAVNVTVHDSIPFPTNL